MAIVLCWLVMNYGGNKRNQNEDRQPRVRIEIGCMDKHCGLIYCCNELWIIIMEYELLHIASYTQSVCGINC